MFPENRNQSVDWLLYDGKNYLHENNKVGFNTRLTGVY